MEWKKYKFHYREFDVSPTGKVRNEHGRMLKGTMHKNGFRVINIKFFHNMKQYSRSLLIHRMVADCWVENPEKKPYVLHINGNLLDNKASNLAWATPQEKIEHQKVNGKVASNRKLTQKEVYKIKKILIENQMSVAEISRKFEVSHTQIHRIKREENWSNVILLFNTEGS